MAGRDAIHEVRMIRTLLFALLAAGSLSTARASTLDTLRLRPTTVLLATSDVPGFTGAAYRFHPARPASLPGGGGDAAEVSFLAGTGFVLVGAVANLYSLLPTLAVGGATGTLWGGTAALFAGVALWAAIAKADAWLFDIDRSWASAFAGAGLGLATGVLLGVALSATVDDGPGFNKLAAALTGVLFGGAVATPLWTLADPFGLTPTKPADDFDARATAPAMGRFSLPLASATF
ncbi:MAG: hypothetical protein RL199_1841 [Pseudomonadota bacterium]|jgi:hypothetical protein